MADKITSLARSLRNTPTPAEAILWSYLRLKQIEGQKFRRQVPVGNYIVDFVCFEKRLVIEVDGGGHADSSDDKKRDRWFKENGFIVLRFWNNEVMGNIEGVVGSIRDAVIISPSP